jgi:two-component system response regulator DevR
VPVDDSVFAREGIRAILTLDRGIRVVGEADSRARAIKEVHRTKPDVVIMDMRLPDGTGYDSCRDILSAFPRTRILFFSAYSDDNALYDAVMAGGAWVSDQRYRGQRPPPRDQDDCRRTIPAWAARSGPQSFRKEEHPTNAPTALPPILSRIDLTLLSLLAKGATNKAIAVVLKKEPHTIVTLQSALYKKLRVTRRAQAVHHFITQLSQHYPPLDITPISARGKG